MQRLGLVLITLGFVGGCLASVLDPDRVELVLLVPSLVLGAAGVTLVQVALHRGARDEGRVTANLQTMTESLELVAAAIVELDDGKVVEEVYQLPDAIEARFAEPMQRFADARESLVPRYGVQAYADVMSAFAAGERYLNRVWSAAAEGYVDEAHTYLGKAREQLLSARDQLRGLTSSGA